MDCFVAPKAGPPCDRAAVRPLPGGLQRSHDLLQGRQRERPGYEWLFRNEEYELPQEYFTPANQRERNDITLINVAFQGSGYENFSGWVGPAGFSAGPFGPNMGVRKIQDGSPADGKLLVGDVIYSANGKMLGDKAWLVMADAITESEKRKAKGELRLGVRRGGENIDVELTIPVMGTYSSTAPYECPKTEKIVAQLEAWMAFGRFQKRHPARLPGHRYALPARNRQPGDAWPRASGNLPEDRGDGDCGGDRSDQGLQGVVSGLGLLAAG